MFAKGNVSWLIESPTMTGLENFSISFTKLLGYT
jgi:hypothetical protein